MKCKSKFCDLRAGHIGRCQSTDAIRNHVVTTQPVTCNQCAAHKAEIERLRNQIREMERPKPKRDRVQYMRDRRAGKKPLGVAYG